MNLSSLQHPAKSTTYKNHGVKTSNTVDEAIQIPSNDQYNHHDPALAYVDQPFDFPLVIVFEIGLVWTGSYVLMINGIATIPLPRHHRDRPKSRSCHKYLIVFVPA